MPELKTLAIPLRKIDFSETSQVLRFLTRDGGKLTAIARGAKRKKGSFQGPFDLLVEFEIIRLGKSQDRLDVVTAASPRRTFPRLRKDLQAFYAASYAAELVDELVPERQPAPEVYDLFVGFLENLESDAPMPLALFRFEGGLLKERGFFPRLLECGGCQGRITQTDAWFSPQDGGAICSRCKPRDRDAYRIQPRVLYAADHLAGGGNLPAPLYRELALHVRRLLDLHIRQVTERKLKSLRFVQEICSPKPLRPVSAPPSPAPPAGPASRGS